MQQSSPEMFWSERPLCRVFQQAPKRLKRHCVGAAIPELWVLGDLAGLDAILDENQ
jgi:hypothetical protein